MKKLLLFTMILGFTFSQSTVRTDVHLFQNFMMDAPVTAMTYLEGFFLYSGYDGGSQSDFGVQGGYPFSEKLEIMAKAGFGKWSPDQGDGESGLSDAEIWVRYKLDGLLPEGSSLAAGGYITLPIGEEKIGHGNFDMGGFAALRHPLQDLIVVTAALGLRNYETVDDQGKDDRETAMMVSGGGIYSMNDQMAVVAELVMWTKFDYMMVSAGLDYAIGQGSKVRGAFGLGLDDGAPDTSFYISFLKNL